MLEFSLKQLEAFVAAVEYSSFTRAAEMLYLTQSTVSTHIQGLERTLGVPLFQRDARRKIALTEPGQQVYLAARDILARCRSLQDAPAALTPPPLRIGASTVPAQCLLPDLMSGFLKQRPDCRFLLRRGDSLGVHRMLQSGEIQVGFVGGKLEDPAFHYEPLQKDRLVMVTAPTPQFQNQPPSGAEELLLREPFLAREEASGTWRATAQWLHHRGIHPSQLQILARMENPEAIRRAVAQGMGISILSSLMVAEDVAQGRLLCFELGEHGAWRELYLAINRDPPPDPLREAFVHFILHATRGSH